MTLLITVMYAFFFFIYFIKSKYCIGIIFSNFWYKLVKKYFRMTHSEDKVTVDCEIRTMNMEDFSEITLADECNQNKIVLDANLFTELLNRLDNLADELKVVLSPNPPYFRLIASGIAVSSDKKN